MMNLIVILILSFLAGLSIGLSKINIFSVLWAIISVIPELLVGLCKKIFKKK